MPKPKITFDGWWTEAEYGQWMQALDEQDSRNIAKYQQQLRSQKPGAFISCRQFLVFFGKVIALAAGLILLCYGAVLVAAAWFGI